MRQQIGRNSPFHCGSGKKYKKCCLEKDMTKITEKKSISGVLYGPIPSDSDDHFLSRFMFQNTSIRDFVVPKDKRNEFDKDYDSVLQNLIEAKYAKDTSLKCMSNHVKEIQDGKDGIVTGHQLNINHPIDTELNIFFKDFFIRATMAIGGLQKLMDKWFKYNIAFLFSDDEKKFERGAAVFKLDKNDPKFKLLAEFIKSHREGWYRKFKDLRDDIEHNGYKLPQIKHRIGSDGNVEILFPVLNGQSIEETLTFGFNNLSGLCEEIIVFIMSLELKEPNWIWRIPEEKREKFNWAHYKVAMFDFPEALCSCS